MKSSSSPTRAFSCARLIVPALFAVLFLSGCVVGRRQVPLTIPAATGAAPAAKGSINIDTVTDQRAFQNKPPQPSTPSIDGDVTKLTAAEKSMFIGRQRNTYGMAMGDIALPAGDSVVKQAKALVTEGLKRRGYTVADGAGADNTTTVTIDEFWAWFTPGMFSVTFEARVNCTLNVTRAGQTTKLVVQGYGRNSGQIASDANWQLAYTRAFENFLAKLDEELPKAGL